MTTAALHDMMKAEYLRLLNDIPENMFVNLGQRQVMQTRVYMAQSNINGKQLWTKYKDWLKKIRNEYVTHFTGGLILSELPSGTTLRDAIKSFIIKMWKEQNPVSN